MADQLSRREKHLIDIAVLLFLAVHVEPDPQILQLRCPFNRAERRDGERAVNRLPLFPGLPFVTHSEVPVAARKVAADREAVDRLFSFFRREVAAA